MPPRLDEAFLRAIRAQIAEMPAQRSYLNGEPFGEIANLWQTPAPEPEAEPELPFEPDYSFIERDRIDSRIWRAYQTPVTLGVDLAVAPVQPAEENKQELDRQWKELMFGKAQA